MKNIIINAESLTKLNPCKDRFDVWKEKHNGDSFTLEEFLTLESIIVKDRIWVALMISPRFIVECFAIDCANRCNTTYNPMLVATAASDVGAANAALTIANYAAHFAADYAAYTSPRDQERKNQIDAILMLIEEEN